MANTVATSRQEKNGGGARHAFVGGLCAGGLLVAVAFACGWLASGSNSATPVWSFPETALHASSTAISEEFSVATGPVSDDAEGIFFLDGITGELTCLVMSPRSGEMNAVFKSKPATDLGAAPGKKPKYLLVTGLVNFRGARVKPAASVAYVIDATAGRYVAYGVPYNPQKSAQNVPQADQMIVLAAGSVRDLGAGVDE
ncbi:MAG: hypothetical protein KDA60_17435 [Planctomycetales bacterium]|nr:hypothetical protein [Planctomycetales bacterium]